MTKRLAWPCALSLILFLAYLHFHFGGGPAVSETTLDYLLAAALAALSVALMRTASFVLFDILFVRRKRRQAPALLRALFSMAFYPPVFLSIYSIILHKSVSGITATSAAVTVLVGLALQDTLGNFFAGVSIHTEAPFHIGDTIKIRDFFGRVEAVTWRTTTIRTTDDSVVIFPNSIVARDPLEIFEFDRPNRSKVLFDAPYSVPPQEVITLVRELVRSTPGVATEVSPSVRIHKFEDSGITYAALYWTKDYMKVVPIEATIRERIWYAFHRNHIEFPFPVRHILQNVETQVECAAEEADSLALLDLVDIFEPLNAQGKEIVVGSMERYLYAPRECIIRYGDPSHSMFLIRRGTVDVCLPTEFEGPKRIAVLGPGDYFGEMGLFTGEPRTADITAIEETEVLEIRKEIMQDLLRDNTVLAEAFSRKIAERQLRLQQCSLDSREEEQQARTDSILQRVMHFFNL